MGRRVRGERNNNRVDSICAGNHLHRHGTPTPSINSTLNFSTNREETLETQILMVHGPISAFGDVCCSSQPFVLRCQPKIICLHLFLITALSKPALNTFPIQHETRSYPSVLQAGHNKDPTLSSLVPLGRSTSRHRILLS